MTDLVSSQFVSPSSRPELNGEYGLHFSEVAKSTGAEEKFLRVVATANKITNLNGYLTLKDTITLLNCCEKVKEKFTPILDNASSYDVFFPTNCFKV